MNINRKEIKSNAKASLKGNWAIMILCYVTVSVVSIAISFIYNEFEKEINSLALPLLSLLSSLFWSLLTLFWSSVIYFGLYKLDLTVSRNGKAEFQTLFSGANKFLKALGTILFIGLFIELWALLFIVPGIIAALRYSQTFYILSDHPDMGIREAVNASKTMMKGHKGELFVLGLSFIGWEILCAIPLFLGYLWLTPYMKITMANFYNKLCEEQTPTIEAEQEVIA